MRNMVTRTVHGTEVTIKVVDKTTEQIVEDKIVISKRFVTVDKEGVKHVTDADKLKKAIEKALPADKILVSIVDYVFIDKCYGIPTDKFMELAVELDPNTRAKIEAEEATETVSEN